MLLLAAADAARAQTIPANLPGTITRTAWFAWYDRDGAYFTLEGFSNYSYAYANRTSYVPRLSQATRDGDQFLFSIKGGPAGQQDVIDGIPGDPHYSPVMRVLIMVWRSGVTPVMLTSYKDVYAQNRAGRLLAYETGVRLNGPIVWQSTDLEGQGGCLPPTLLQDVQVVSLRPRSGGREGQVEVAAYPCYWNGQVVAFMDLEHADGIVPDANGNPVQREPVPLIGLPIMGAAALGKLYAVEGQDPVVNSLPGRNDYSPLWQLLFVRRQRGFSARLTSEQAILDALAAGRVTVEPAGENAVVNGPIVDPRLVER
jgi:hypothetical protein